jgi:hypothetical protein
MTIYVWRLFDRAFGFTSEKEDAQDFGSYVVELYLKGFWLRFGAPSGESR